MYRRLLAPSLYVTDVFVYRRLLAPLPVCRRCLCVSPPLYRSPLYRNPFIAALYPFLYAAIKEAVLLCLSAIVLY